MVGRRGAARPDPVQAAWLVEQGMIVPHPENPDYYFVPETHKAAWEKCRYVEAVTEISQVLAAVEQRQAPAASAFDLSADTTRRLMDESAAPTPAESEAAERRSLDDAPQAFAQQRTALIGEIEQVSAYAAQPFDAGCVRAITEAAERLGHSHMPVVSGAGHDAIYAARLAPAGMVFVPCKDGISHNEIEDAKPEHITAGCNVLLHAMLERAGIAG